MQAKRNVAMVAAEAKSQAWEEFSEAMQNEFRITLRKFPSTIPHLRSRNQYTSIVYSGCGLLQTLTWDIVSQRTECLKVSSPMGFLLMRKVQCI